MLLCALLNESANGILIATLLFWIDAHTSCKVSKALVPEVRLLTPLEMTDEYYRGSEVARPVDRLTNKATHYFATAAIARWKNSTYDPLLINKGPAFFRLALTTVAVKS